MLLRKFENNGIEVGVDEVGRGCLAGPVVAAAFVTPDGLDFISSKVNDSKKLSEKKRRELFLLMLTEYPDRCRIGICSPEEIDEYNILNASIMAMHRALDRLDINFDRILVDGDKFKDYMGAKHVCIVKGDSKYASIAAASILAKVYRDELMRKYSKMPIYEKYLWDKNKGYPTKEHRESIKAYGICDLHRKSFSFK